MENMQCRETEGYIESVSIWKFQIYLMYSNSRYVCIFLFSS